MPNKVLVIVAHPDDEVLGCGGTIRKHVVSGDKVHCLVIGTGVTSRKGLSGEKGKVAQLRRGSLESAATLGIHRMIFRDYPDNSLDTVRLLDIIQTIEEVKDKYKPNIVYTHHQGDLNIDHQIVYKSVLTACRPLGGETVREIYSFEVLSSTEWNYSASPFVPNVFVDISGTLLSKLSAIQCYTDEVRDFPHPRSLVAIRSLAAKHGSTVGCQAAEAFMLVRKIL